MIQTALEKPDSEGISHPISFSRERSEVAKSFPVVETMPGIRQFYPSLPMPSTFSNFSMSLPSLPDSLIQTLQQNPASPMSMRFAPWSEHPPPLVRVSEPWEVRRPV